MLYEQTHTAIADLDPELRRILGPEGGRGKPLLKGHNRRHGPFHLME